MEPTVISDSVVPTVMALREELMAYYKGDCVQKLVHDGNIQRISLYNLHRREYQYQRREEANQDEQIVLVGKLPVFTMHRIPDTLVLHDLVLKRSPQFREIGKALEKFMATYLQGVVVEHNKEVVTYA